MYIHIYIYVCVCVCVFRMFMIFVQVSQVGQSIIRCFLDGGLECKGAMSEKFVSKALDEKGDGLDV